MVLLRMFPSPNDVDLRLALRSILADGKSIKISKGKLKTDDPAP